MKKLLTIVLICSFAVYAWGQGSMTQPRLKIEEFDGTPTGRPRTLEVTDGSLTDAGNGVFQLTIPTTSLEITVDILSNDASWTNDGTSRIWPKDGLTGYAVSIDSLSVDNNLQIAGNYTFPVTAPSEAGAVISYDSATGTLKWGTVGGQADSVAIQIISNDMNNYTGPLVSVSNDIALHYLSLDIISADMNNYTGPLTYVTNDVATLYNRTDIISNDINNYEGNLVYVTNDIATLYTQQLSQDSNIISNANSITIISNDLNNYTGPLIYVSNDVATLYTQSTIISNDLANYTGPLVYVTNDIATLYSTTATNTTNISIISNDLNNFTGPMTYVTNDIATLYASVGDVAINQIVSVISSDLVTGTTTIPSDDTIPQITEGEEYMALSITPAAANNILVIEVTGCFDAEQTNQVFCVALFSGDTADAIASTHSDVSGGAYYRPTVSFNHYRVAGTTDAITFRVRAGMGVGGTTTFNGVNSGRLYGGTMASSITITEYTP